MPVLNTWHLRHSQKSFTQLRQPFVCISEPGLFRILDCRRCFSAEQAGACVGVCKVGQPGGGCGSVPPHRVLLRGLPVLWADTASGAVCSASLKIRCLLINTLQLLCFGLPIPVLHHSEKAAMRFWSLVNVCLCFAPSVLSHCHVLLNCIF